MNREVSIILSGPSAAELAYKLGVVLDEPEQLEEAISTRCSEEELRVGRQELSSGKQQAYVYSVALWRFLADEARCDDSLEALAERIDKVLDGIPSIRYERALVPKRAPGNVRTRLFANTSRFPDALVRRMIDFILEGRRLPTDCRVKIEQSRQHWCTGRAHFASKPQGYHRMQGRRAYGGSVYVAANIEHRDLRVRGGSGGYLPIQICGATEDFFAVLAHEIRHVFQGYRPLYRECRKVRRHTFGTNAKLIEIDASLFEVRALRRFRREWPAPARATLPLP